MNIQDSYNTQLVQKEKNMYTHVQDIWAMYSIRWKHT